MGIQVYLRHEGLRAPAFARVAHSELYAACLEQSAWADAQGFDVVSIAEHHGLDDGYLPAPLTLAAAIAGRTKRIRISLALIAALHDPIRLAEQIAVLDLVSQGRETLIMVPGYRREEFEMAGIDRAQRGRLLEEAVETMRQAWTGEPFTWRGRTVRVTPKPRVPPSVMVAGATAAAARRAARLRAGFHAAVSDPRIVDAYRAECARLGIAAGGIVGGSPVSCVHVSDDPERDWTRIAPYALYDAQTYASWGVPGAADHVPRTLADLRRNSRYRVVTPDECVELAQETGMVLLQPIPCGLPLEWGWASLELFAAKVLPRLRGTGTGA
ncbi:MAG: LLM class flavin-dependent oxidoreductase [Candidatus Binatia bacterium]